MIADKILIGSGAVATAQLVGEIPTDGTPLVDVIKIVVQLVVGIATLLSLLKKRNDNNNNGGQPPLTPA